MIRNGQTCCENCVFFNKHGKEWSEKNYHGRLSGECLRYPPRDVACVEDDGAGGISTEVRSQCPDVLGTEWCGEFKLKVYR